MNLRIHTRNKKTTRLECLESRTLLDAGGLLWGIDGRLSVSFVPDGTSVAHQQSELFANFESLGDVDAWQSTILRGFQTWAQHANIDIGHVMDDGSELGASWATTGDERFGDIRVAAIPMESDIYATSVPTDEFVDGTWVGDILFNSNADIPSLDALFAVAVHEAGHIFGVEHSNDSNSPMFGHTIPDVTTPSGQDLAQLRGNFGFRQADMFELLESQNEVYSIGLNLDAPLLPSMMFAQLDHSSDSDQFVIEQSVDLNEPVAVRLMTDQISQLQPTLRVRDASGQLLGEANYSDQTELGQLLVLPESAIQQGNLTIEISSDALSPNDVGAYTLIVSQGKPKPLPPSGGGTENGVGNLRRSVERIAKSRIRELTPQEIAVYLNDQLNGNLAADEEILVDVEAETDGSNELMVSSTSRIGLTSSLAGANDSDRHHFTIPDDVAAGAAMFVSLVSLSSSGRFQAMASVEAIDGKELTSQTVVQNQHASIVQIDNPTPGQTVTIQVELHPDSQVPRGNYKLVVRFGDPARASEVTEVGVVSSSSSQDYPLRIHRTQLFQFGLAGASGETESELVATILSSNDEELLTIRSPRSEFQTTSSLLPSGEYTVRVATDALTNHDFTLTARPVGEPLGVEPVDPTESPFCSFEWLDEWLSCLWVLGDTNGDGQVDFDDFLNLSANFGETDATREDGDLNADTVVDFDDFLILSRQFGKEPVFEDDSAGD